MLYILLIFEIGIKMILYNEHTYFICINFCYSMEFIRKIILIFYKYRYKKLDGVCVYASFSVCLCVYIGLESVQ